MKRLIIILIFFFPTILFSQIRETILTDTSIVKWYFDHKLNDTVYCLRDHETKAKWVVYYDTNKKQKAFETEKIYYAPSFEYSDNSTSWYKNGALKSKEYMSKDTAI
ncbi:MAG TPA: hypothetical protein VLB84_06170 [Bacteroidia bacterium]|nr:hypothetical protein [Bacteroidia bacterium]